MTKSFFFLGLLPTHPEDRCRVSSGRDHQVRGGSKERHEQAAETCRELSKEFRKDPPQTPGEARMIMLDVVKRIG